MVLVLAVSAAAVVVVAAASDNVGAVPTGDKKDAAGIVGDPTTTGGLLQRAGTLDERQRVYDACSSTRDRMECIAHTHPRFDDAEQSCGEWDCHPYTSHDNRRAPVCCMEEMGIAEAAAMLNGTHVVFIGDSTARRAGIQLRAWLTRTAFFDTKVHQSVHRTVRLTRLHERRLKDRGTHTVHVSSYWVPSVWRLDIALTSNWTYTSGGDGGEPLQVAANGTDGGLGGGGVIDSTAVGATAAPTSSLLDGSQGAAAASTASQQYSGSGVSRGVDSVAVRGLRSASKRRDGQVKTKKNLNVPSTLPLMYGVSATIPKVVVMSISTHDFLPAIRFQNALDVGSPFVKGWAHDYAVRVRRCVLPLPYLQSVTMPPVPCSRRRL
jgi:hypothetical protein